VKDLRRKHFDFVFDMQGLLRTGLLTSRVLADRKVGRTDAREWSGMFYGEKVALPPRWPAQPCAGNPAAVLSGAGGQAGAARHVEVPRGRRLEPQLRRRPRRRQADRDVPDSRRAEKCWGGFKQLTELILREDKNRKVVWAGSNYVHDRGAYLRAQFFNLTGNTSLLSLPALIRRADWVIANDSGPMHLAAAMGVHVLGIFGPTDPRLFGPYPLNAPGNVVVQAPVGDLKLLSAKDVYGRFQKRPGAFRLSRTAGPQPVPRFPPCSIRSSSVSRPTLCGRRLPRNTSTSISMPHWRSTRPGGRNWSRWRACAAQKAANTAMAALPKGSPEFLAKVAEMKAVSAQVKEREALLKELEEKARQAMLTLPNLPHASVPEGRSAEDNVVYSTHGDTTAVSPHAVPHWEIPGFERRFDFSRGAKVTGAGFPFYVGDGARLVRALLHFFLEEDGRAGYVEVNPPIFVNAASATATGQLPDKEGQMYETTPDHLYAVPTAEVPLTNFFRDEILDEAALPIYRCAYTPCFRREAGSYGKDVRGLNRLHQFDKVELLKWVHPSTSYEELDKLRDDAERLLRKLELPYRVLLMCGGDLGFVQSKKYDLEVWSGGQKRWLEVSSCSNFETFQARRAQIRFRSQGDRQAGARAHAQWLRPGRAARAGRPAGEQSPARRAREDPGRTRAVFRERILQLCVSSRRGWLSRSSLARGSTRPCWPGRRPPRAGGSGESAFPEARTRSRWSCCSGRTGRSVAGICASCISTIACGAEAKRDQAFCGRVCRALGLEL
jgi:seryl-tRNA synthetase